MSAWIKKSLQNLCGRCQRVCIYGRGKELDADTRPCEVKQIGKYTFSIILTQGLNRQIRRMCEALGYKVTKLVRIRIMNVELGSLKSGAVRKIEGQELKKLYEQAGTHEGTGGAFE